MDIGEYFARQEHLLRAEAARSLASTTRAHAMKTPNVKLTPNGASAELYATRFERFERDGEMKTLEQIALEVAEEVYGPLKGGAVIRMREFINKFMDKIAKQSQLVGPPVAEGKPDDTYPVEHIRELLKWSR